MLKKLLFAIIIMFMLPSLVQAYSYLIVFDEDYLRNPNLDGTYDGIPLPVVDELKKYFNADVDVAGVNLKATTPFSRFINAHNYDLIIAIGRDVCEAAYSAASNNKNQHFALIDTRYTKYYMPENAVGYRFNSALGAYLAGFISAKIAQRGHIAFIGGNRNLETLDLSKSFKEGALYADPGITINYEYIDGFFDNRTALSRANNLFNGKTDVIFHVAGYSGASVFEAAKRTGKWTIGLNTDLYATLDRAVILTSVTVDYNMAIMEACMDFESGKFKGGEVVLMTLSNHGVDLGDTTNVPPEIMREVEQVKADIISGEIKLRDYNNKQIREPGLTP